MSNWLLCRKVPATIPRSRQVHPSQCAFYVASILCVLLLSATSYATDITWTNSNAGWDIPAEWSPSQVPGSSDRAIFSDSAAIAGYAIGLNVSNDVVGNVLFSGTTKGMFWKNSTNTLTVLNNFILDQTSAATAIDTFRTGTIVVTNASGNAVFNVGSYTDGGKGLLTMQHQNLAGDTTITNYPALVANSFLVTSNSTFLFNAGTLTTFGGSIDGGATLTFTAFAPAASDIATWNILGGTNAITYAGAGAAAAATELAFTAGGTFDINVVGTNTLLTVGGGSFDIGWNGFVNMIVSNGAQFANSGTLYLSRNGGSCSNNTLTVTGPGSLVTVSNEMFVGNAAKNNRVTISAGGVISSATGRLGEGAGSSNNVVTVTGTGSQWKTANFLAIGDSGLGNSMIISNGGQVINAGTFTRLGLNATSVGNSLAVDGAGSQLVATNAASFTVGNVGTLQSVTVKNAGQIMSLGVSVGAGIGSSNNTILVTGASSIWTANGLLTVGAGDQGNQVIVSSGGQFAAASIDVTPTNKAGASLTVAGGTLIATNSVAGAVLRAGGANLLGTVTFNGGTITIDQLMLTNGAASVFNFNSGVLNVKTSVVANGSAFIIGDGVDSATLNLLAFSHTYANGLNISANATLTGVGTIVGNVTLANGATLSPGIGVGTLTLANNLVVNNGAVLQYDLGTSSDLTVVGGNLTLGGTLNVNNDGGFGVGTYTLFTYSGGLTYNGVAIGTTPIAGLYYAIDTGTVGQVNLDVSYTAPAGPITGSSSVNAGDSGDTYSISSVADATSYTWSVPSGATITSGQGTTSITVNFGCSAISGNITVTPSSGSGNGASSSLGVTVTGVSAAGSITGSSAVNAGDGSDVYSISSVSGATTYTWTVPAGATIASGQGTTSITVNYSCSAVSGTVQVTPSNASGCTGGAGSLPVTVTSVGAAGSISGSTTVCAGVSGLTYSISSVSGATTYTWSVPSDATITSGQGSTSITVTWGSTSGSVSVTPANGNACTGGAGNLSVTVNPLPSTPTASNKGPIIEGDTLNLTASAIAGVTYNWTGPNGFASANQNPSISNATSAASGTYSVTVTDSNGCTSAASSTTALVTALRVTAITVQGNDVQITWLTTGGTTNAVQFTSGAADGSYSTNNFTDIPGSQTILPGSGGDTSTNYIDVGGATNMPARYYRVRLVP